MTHVMEHFAKVCIQSHGMNTGGQTRQDFENEIATRAETSFPDPRLSKAQRFTRYITEDSTGQLLFKASRLAPVAKPDTQAAQDEFTPQQKDFGPAGRELNRMALAMAREKNLSLQETHRILSTDPSRAELLRRVAEETRRATQAVSSSRFPNRQAERSSRTREWLDGRG